MRFLILDAGCAFHGQGGALNHLFTKVAKDTLESFGHEVTVTEVEGDWKVEEEHEKIRAADAPAHGPHEELRHGRAAYRKALSALLDLERSEGSL